MSWVEKEMGIISMISAGFGGMIFGWHLLSTGKSNFVIK